MPLSVCGCVVVVVVGCSTLLSMIGDGMRGDNFAYLITINQLIIINYVFSNWFLLIICFQTGYLSQETCGPLASLERH